MKMPVTVAAFTLLICSHVSLTMAAESGPTPGVQKPTLLQASPQTPSAKAPDTVATAQAMRLGHVDIARIGTESRMAKAGQAQLADLKKKLQGQIEAKRNQLDKQKMTLEAKLKTFTPPQREAKAKEFQKKVEEFQKFGMKAEKELQSRQEEFSDKLFKAIEQASTELGKTKGLALVVIKRELLYLGSGVDAQDVTDGLISLIDGQQTKK